MSSFNSQTFDSASTYADAAGVFDVAATQFWRRHGQRAVAYITPQAGTRVLDVGCGTGTSAIPAAISVGPSGEVVALDSAMPMLEAARTRAKEAGVKNIRFVQADMATYTFEPGSFDAVISVFSLFFIEDMAGVLRALWGSLRPGGRLVITSWRSSAFEPAGELFTQEVLRTTPRCHAPARLWKRLGDERALQALFTEAGLPFPDIHMAEDWQSLATPDDWWAIVLGSGFRNDLNGLSTEEVALVRKRTLAKLTAHAIKSIDTRALHAVVCKDP